MLDAANMPTTERESIASITPSGWHNKKIKFNGKSDWLYNRSHLIGYQLTGGNADAKNLMTGTRALNANFADEKDSMVYYENEVATYLKSHPSNHVRYQVTPIFRGFELVARGVRMQAESVEDKGALNYDIYIFNVQPGYAINYLDGTSKKE